MGTLLEFAVAALYLVGAAFNASYTLRNSASFYSGFAGGAWLRPAGAFVCAVVVPNGRAFTIALIAFQLAVAVLILARGDLAMAGLITGAGFSLCAAAVSSPFGTAGNLALAGLQAWLAAVH